MASPGPIPVFPQGPNNDETPYQYVAWPAWLYTADGRSQIFNNAEEVPEGWMSHDEYLALSVAQEEGEPVVVPVTEGERELTADQRREAITKLVDGNTQAALAAMLAEMKELDDSIEFLGSWPKNKLAETIVDNGGPLED